jgi:pilus assembly protein Flp/PilA
MYRLIARVLPRRADRDRGATAVEYGLMVALIAAVIVVGVALLGTNLNTLFDQTADCVSDATLC